MKAKEMFENLGYSLEVNSEDLIKYSKEVCGYTFFRFRLKDKEFCSGYQSIAHTTTRNELEAVIQQFKELGWLEEEKQEIKQETNFEHYKDEIKNLKFDFAFVDGDVVPCRGNSCINCIFNDKHLACSSIKTRWLYRHQVKFQLNQFEYDLIQTYRDGNTDCKLSDRRILRELKDKGYFKCVDYDTNIKDILANCEVTE